MSNSTAEIVDSPKESTNITELQLDEIRTQIKNDTEKMSERKCKKYFEQRGDEFFDKYKWDAEPSEDAFTMTKVFGKALMVELDVFLAQHEQYGKYVFGSTTAQSFIDTKPSELLSQFGEWLKGAAQNADYDYMDLEDFE